MVSAQVYFGGRTKETYLIVCFMRKEENKTWHLGFARARGWSEAGEDEMKQFRTRLEGDFGV